MKQIIFTGLLVGIFSSLSAQETSDSSKTLSTVTITAFEQQRNKIDALTSQYVLPINAADRFNKTSLLNGLNTISGVRMEERSPGSYRLNIRGSSLRAPFGVRNVKIYWNDIPVTDAGGNTYLNQFAFNNFSTIEVSKGPAGSLYGAGTGGLMLTRSLENNPKPLLNIEYISGSFGLQNILTSVGFGSTDHQGLITYAHSKSDGYRDHTATKKDNASFVSRLKVSDKQQLTASILYNSIYYETPGGLTLTEYNANPKQERPAAGGFPGASGAKAAIDQKNFIAGISHVYRFSESFKNSTVLFGTFAQIKNPTFRNYERRNEPGFGGRTTFSFDHHWSDNKLRIVAGSELQQGYFNTQVSKNKAGNPDTLQTNDDINLTAYNFFAQADLETSDHWIFTAGASINKSRLAIARLNKYPVVKQVRTYDNEISPRFTVLKRILNWLSFSGSISKGFSPPTIAEVLPSTGVISTFLEAEQGTNYELGAQADLLNGELQFDVAAFYFKLKNALVVRKDASNADYYINAGDATQKGIEVGINYQKAFSGSFISQLKIYTAQSVNDFTYGNFVKDATDFSGKKMPSVPDYTASVIADVLFTPGVYINLNLYHSSSIYLNDANSVEAKAYDIAGARIGWKFSIKDRNRINLYAGGDNLFDKVYSLGNDINAAAGRYYNVAAGRNYYFGIGWQLGK